MTNGKANDIGLNLLERPKMPFARVQRHGRRAGNSLLAACLAESRSEVRTAPRVARLDCDVREMLCRQRLPVTLQSGAEQDARQLPNVARPAVPNEDGKRVV